MKNITVSVPDDVYREARIRAAERGSSVSGLVAEYLRSLYSESPGWMQDQIVRFRAGDRLDRDEIHGRAVR